MIRIPYLDIHVTHECNFQCKECAHFSQHKFRGMHIPLDTMESWYKDWYQRIEPGDLGLLGGEPFLHPNLPEMCHLTRKYFPNSRIELVTNASLIHLHPNLWEDLIETDITLGVSVHSNNEKYRKIMIPKLKIAREWKDRGATVHFFDFAISKWENYSKWQKIYKGEGENIMPFEDNDPESSWNNCPTEKICFQFHENAMWKCAPLAYLPLMKEKYPNISEKWDPYLKYKPLTADCTDEEIVEFFSRGCESVCSMCPSKHIYVKDTKDPLRNEIK